MTMTATEFKAKCLAVLDAVHERGETVSITKHGRIVATLVPHDAAADQPWRALRATKATWRGNPFAPVVADEDLAVLRK